MQKSLADKLLEAYNEEEFIQEELKDIRKMNKEKYLAEKVVMSEERKVFFRFRNNAGPIPDFL